MAQALKLFQISRFSGQNTRVSKFLIDDAQCQEILNFHLSDRGSLSKISGYVKWNGTSLGASKMLGGERFYKQGASAQFVEAHNGKLYKGDDGTKTFTEIATGLNATAKWRMKINRDLLFMIDGVDENKKWNGTTVTKMGIVAPTAAATAAIGTAGNLNGAYTWKVTFVTPTHESNGSPASNSISPVNQKGELTAVPVSANTAVTKRRIYRTAAGGTDHFFVGEINDNTTTVFTDNVADAGLGSLIPTQKDPPSVGKYIEAFKNRLWIAGISGNATRVAFSEYFEPEAWPTSYYVDIPMSAGDEITGLKVLGDVLVVYGHNTPYLVIGETPFDFVVKRSFAQTGTESDRTIVLVENSHIYLSRSGYYAFDGAVSRLISDDIEPEIRSLNQTYIGNACAGYHERTKIYRSGVTQGTNTTNSSELCYDLRTNAWFKTDRTIEYYHSLDGPGDVGQLFSASPTAGFLFEEDSGDTADGATIKLKWLSKAYSLDILDFPKQLRHILVWSTPNPFPITLAVEIDDDSARTQTFTLPSSSQLPRYGTAQYGTAVYGGAGIIRVANVFAQKMVGNYVEVSLEANADSPLTLYTIEMSFRVNPHLRIR